MDRLQTLALVGAVLLAISRALNSDLPRVKSLPMVWRSLLVALVGLATGTIDALTHGGAATVGAALTAAFGVSGPSVVMLLVETIFGGPKPPSGPGDGGIDVPVDDLSIPPITRTPTRGLQFTALAAVALSGCWSNRQDVASAALVTGAEMSADDCKRKALEIIDLAASCREAKDGLAQLERSQVSCVAALHGQGFKPMHCQRDSQ